MFLHFFKRMKRVFLMNTNSAMSLLCLQDPFNRCSMCDYVCMCNKFAHISLLRQYFSFYFHVVCLAQNLWMINM
ncbi:unnamed protein product [Ixodes pacificus]